MENRKLLFGLFQIIMVLSAALSIIGVVWLVGQTEWAQTRNPQNIIGRFEGRDDVGFAQEQGQGGRIPPNFGERPNRGGGEGFVQGQGERVPSNFGERPNREGGEGFVQGQGERVPPNFGEGGNRGEGDGVEQVQFERTPPNAGERPGRGTERNLSTFLVFGETALRLGAIIAAVVFGQKGWSYWQSKRI